jgi:hypothetical protein
MIIMCCVFLFQGLEIVNPQAAEKRVQEANEKYFSTTAVFRKVTDKTWTELQLSARR